MKLNAIARHLLPGRCFYLLEVCSAVGACQTADLRFGSARRICICMTQQQPVQAARAFSILPLSSSLLAAVTSVLFSSKLELDLPNNEENANTKVSRASQVEVAESSMWPLQNTHHTVSLWLLDPGRYVIQTKAYYNNQI